MGWGRPRAGGTSCNTKTPLTSKLIHYVAILEGKLKIKINNDLRREREKGDEGSE
jgi:hypothetical protein